MLNKRIEDEEFLTIDYTTEAVEKAEYFQCVFKGCNFSDSDMSGILFEECEFVQCNLSSANLKQTAFREVTFKDCKLLGLSFNSCNQFLLEADFESCNLDYASFYGMQWKKRRFTNCSLQETDFSEADLSASLFDNCNLDRAVFDRTNLKNADLRTAYHFVIDPEQNDVQGARFSLDGLPGLLERYGIVVA